jgi:hypothetical protein
MKLKFMILMSVISFGCLSGCDTTHEKVEVSVSEDIKRVADEVVPASDYVFYAAKESCPRTILDLKNSSLIICGDIESNADLQLLNAGLTEYGEPLFKSVHHYIINPNVISGALATTGNVTLTLDSGESIEIPREKSVFGRDTDVDSMVEEALKRMNESGKSVLLIGRNVRSAALEPMVEIVFADN